MKFTIQKGNGLKGEISIVKGIEVEEETLVTNKGFVVKKRQRF